MDDGDDAFVFFSLAPEFAACGVVEARVVRSASDGGGKAELEAAHGVLE